MRKGSHVVTPELPPVAPDFLMERDQRKLEAYARGLLAHLRRIRTGQKTQGYPKATVKSAAVWLIESTVVTTSVPSSLHHRYPQT
jgi:hypothetical protein